MDGKDNYLGSDSTPVKVSDKTPIDLDAQTPWYIKT